MANPRYNSQVTQPRGNQTSSRKNGWWHDDAKTYV